MPDTVLVALIGALASGLCALLGAVASAKLTQYRLSQLEAKVQAHNNLVERMYEVEKRQDIMEERMDQLHKHDE